MSSNSDILLTSSSCILSFLAGLSVTYSAAIIGYIYIDSGSQTELALLRIFIPIILIAFIVLTLLKGWGKNVTTLAAIIIIFLVINNVLIAIVAFSPETEEGHNIALGAVFTLLETIGIITSIVNISLAIALGKVLSLPKLCVYIIYVVGAIIGALFGIREFNITSIVLVVSGALGVILLGKHIAYQAITRNNQKYWLIRWLTFTLVRKRRKQLIESNLNNTNFDPSIDDQDQIDQPEDEESKASTSTPKYNFPNAKIVQIVEDTKGGDVKADQND